MDTIQQVFEVQTSWEILDHQKINSIVSVVSSNDVNEPTNLDSSLDWTAQPIRLKAFQHPELPEMTAGAHCKLRILVAARHHLKIVRLVVVSNARHLELYDKTGEYQSTVRGHKAAIPPEVADTVKSQGTRWFECDVNQTADSCQIDIKFLSLYEPACLMLRRLWLVVVPHSWQSRSQDLGQGAINLERVQELMGGDTANISPQAKQLMESITQAQQTGANVANSSNLIATLMASMQMNAGAMGGRQSNDPGTTLPDSKRSSEDSSSGDLRVWLQTRLDALEQSINTKLEGITSRLATVESKVDAVTQKLNSCSSES